MAYYLIEPERPRPDLPMTEIEKKLQQSCHEFRPVLAQDWLAKTDWSKQELEALFQPNQLRVREIG
jgi:hypothetical protein